MRSHVSAFGRFKFDASVPWVEVLIDHFGKIPAEAANLDEIVDAGTQYSLQSTELLEQLAPFNGTQAWNGLQYRLVVTLGSFAAVSRNGESVCLVAYALNQV